MDINTILVIMLLMLLVVIIHKVLPRLLFKKIGIIKEDVYLVRDKDCNYYEYKSIKVCAEPGKFQEGIIKYQDFDCKIKDFNDRKSDLSKYDADKINNFLIYILIKYGEVN